MVYIISLTEYQSMLTFIVFPQIYILMLSIKILSILDFLSCKKYKKSQRVEIDYCLHIITREIGLEGVLLRLLSYSQLRSGNVQMIIHENDRYLLGNQI